MNTFLGLVAFVLLVAFVYCHYLAMGVPDKGSKEDFRRASIIPFVLMCVVLYFLL